MATIEQKIHTEQAARALLAERGIPEPSYIEYGFTCIRLLWEESRLMLRVDIDDEATTEHVILVDELHPSQPPLDEDGEDDIDNQPPYDPLIILAQPPSPN